MKYNEFDDNEQLENEQAEAEQLENEQKGQVSSKKRKKIRFDIKVFLRSLFLTVLVAALMIVAWRAGVFAVDYVTAKKEGMSSSEAASYAWDDAVSFFVKIADGVSPVILTDKNVLVIGSDENKVNADVIMLVHLDAESKSVDVISILRDTMITSDNRTHRINSSLHMGGEDYLVEQVEDLVGVSIDNYVFLNYDGFKQVIDAVGGVDFYVPQDMDYEDPYQDLYIHLKEGQQHLDGDHAEQLVRFRRYPMGDVKRTEVQRDFVMALYKQKLNSSLVKNIHSLVPAIMKFVDTDVSVQEAVQYASFMSKFEEEGLHSYQLPVKMVEGQAYVVPDYDGIELMLEEIEKSHEPVPEGEEAPEIDYVYRDDVVDTNGEAVTGN